MSKLGLAGPERIVVDYTGGEAEKKKKNYLTEATIDASALGFDECKRRVVEHESKMKQLEEKIESAAPTKKNKSAGGEIFVAKEQLDVLKGDGDYRAALTFVRQKEQEEKDRLREEREKLEEEGTVSKGKKSFAASESSSIFEPDGEVAAVVQSAVEGSEGAQGKLQAGAGTMTYVSEVRNEVPTLAFAAGDKIPPKLKRAPTRDDALKTIKALLWLPPAMLPCYPTVLMLLGETKIKSQPGGTCVELCTQLSTMGPTAKAVPQLVLPVLLAHTGVLAGANWQVKVACIGIVREVLQHLAQPGFCPRQVPQLLEQALEAVQSAAAEKRKEVKKAADEALEFLDELKAAQVPIEGRPVDEVLKQARAEVAQAKLPAPLRPYIEAVVASCCVEADSQSNAEALVEAELQPLVPSAKGAALEVFQLKDVLSRIFR